MFHSMYGPHLIIHSSVDENLVDSMSWLFVHSAAVDSGYVFLNCGFLYVM